MADCSWAMWESMLSKMTSGQATGGGPSDQIRITGDGRRSATPKWGHPGAPTCQHVATVTASVTDPRRLLAALMLLAVLVACGRGGVSEADRQRQLQQRRDLAHCRAERPRLPQLLARFQASREELLGLRAELYRPSAGPKPLDPEEQSRLTLDDQQTEQEQHDEAMEAWREQERQRRAAWERQQAQRLAASEQRLAQAAAALRQMSPTLLQAGSSPQLNGAAVERYRSCRPEAFQ